jgi:hypothetical protein
MSLQDLKIAELRALGDQFGVDLSDVKTKAAVIEELEVNGVTSELREQLSEAEQVEAQPESIQKPVREINVEDPDSIVVRMTRANGHYEIRGLTFTREHPYAITTSDIAQDIFDDEEGFRPATPRELQEYYS